MSANPSQFIQALEATSQDDVVEVSIVLKDGRVFRWDPDGSPDGRMRITKPVRGLLAVRGQHLDDGDAIIYPPDEQGLVHGCMIGNAVPVEIRGKPDVVKCGDVVKAGEPGPLGQWRVVVEFIPDGQEDL